MTSHWTFGCLLLILSCACGGEDFYKLLDVSKDADNREIRRAFKKLALTMHPDKNTDDPQAHDKFVKINRAYEVLKDEDLRKKYDLHGEEGLQDGGRGRQYESWKFYNENFGIYDDDPEIVTFDRSDFTQSVLESQDVWFINFYSARCGHCHELAPAWREMARDLEGVIRIGAVNCLDDFMLCRQQGISGYPSLVFYPEKEKYTGDRTARAMAKEALLRLKVEVHELWLGNYDTLVRRKDLFPLPWLISICHKDGDCIKKRGRLKLAGMLIYVMVKQYVWVHFQATRFRISFKI